MSTTPDAAAPPRVPARRWQAWRNRWSGRLAYTRYHGVWTPGIRWLRNKSLPVKGSAVLACLLLPLAVLLADAAGTRWHRWQDRGVAQERLAQFDAAAQLGAALQRAAAALGRGSADATEARTSLEDEGRGHARLQTLLAAAVEADPALGSAWQLLQQRRAAFLSHRSETGGTDGGLSADAYAEALALLRQTLLRDAPHESAADTALRAGVLALMPDLRDRLGLLGRTARRTVPQADAAAVARRLALQLGAVRQSLDAARAEQDLLRRSVLVDVALMDESLRRVQAYLELIDRHGAALLGGAAGTEPTRAPEALEAAGQSALAAVDALYRAGASAMSERGAATRAAQAATLRWQVALVGLSLLVAVYVLVCVYKVTAGGLRTLCGHLEQLGHGNLSIRPQGWGSDEVGRALNALGTSAAQMSQLFEAVSHGVTAVSHASREVADGNAGLSGRTGQIRQAIGDVAGRADAFSAAMERCAGQVHEAAALVREMQGDAQRSRKAMGQLRRQMQALQARSRDIEKTVGLVETVAYQTKLLSINASVEAARAGLAGKGFAVVAQEVRALAQRSEDAARRIHEIVSGSVREIEDGHLVTERANAAVAGTDRRIATIHQLMGDIVHMTRDGHAGSQAVLDITREVAASADGNARLVAQLSEASAALRTQGDTLKRSVQHFVFA